MKSVLAAITTCKRKPEMVERAIKSVIAQTYTDWDLVVVDDSPADYEFRDDVRKMVEEWSGRDSRIRYVAHDKNYGANHARNTAMKIASDEGYEFIGYLDDDDEWLPEKLEKQIAKFNERDENAALVYCYYYFIDSETNMIKRIKRVKIEGYLYSELMRKGDFIGSTSSPLMRTKCLAEIGGFDEDMKSWQDLEIYLRLAKNYEIACVDEPLVNYYSNHGEHIGGNPARDLMTVKKIMIKNKKYLDADKHACWVWCEILCVHHAMCGEYLESLKTWFKMVSLQPLRIYSNIKVLLNVMVKQRVKNLLMDHTPKLFYTLRNMKRKLKGEDRNWYRKENKHSNS